MAVRTDLNLVVHRDVAREQAAGIQLYELGFRDAKDHLLDPGSLELPAKRVPQVTKELVQAGWRVEAEGKLIRQAGEFKLAVTTGIDWFELGGQVDFGGQSRPLARPPGRRPSRARRWSRSATARWGCSRRTGSRSTGCSPTSAAPRTRTARSGSARRRPGLLDALLASQPEIKLDIGFGKVRQALPRFEGVHPKEAPAGFRGELRPISARAGLARIPPEVRLRRHPGRRHGPGQDHPGSRLAPESPGQAAVEGGRA